MGGSTTKPDDVCRLDPFNAHLQNLEAQREQKKRDQYEQAVALSGAQYTASAGAAQWAGVSVQQWQQKALAAAGIDPSQWNPNKGFEANRDNIKKVYALYAQWYTNDPNLKWAGMAKLAGGTVYGGLLRLVDEKPGVLRIVDSYHAAKGIQMDKVERTFVGMQKDIFMDLGWQHEAYKEGGLGAIKAAYDRGDMSSANYEAWLKIGSGNQELNWEGNRTLLMREQSEILPPGYEKIQDMWGGGAITSQITENTTSPIPGGAPFAQLYPQGNVTEFKDRWTWIDNNMLPDYKNLGDDYRKTLVNQPLEELAKGQFAPDPRPH